MCRIWVGRLLILGLGLGLPVPLYAQSLPRVQWIGPGENKPQAAAGAYYFRRAFVLHSATEPPVEEAGLDLAARGPFTVWLNGTLLGQGQDPRRIFSFEVRKYLRNGENVLAVAVQPLPGQPLGLLVRLGYVPNGQSKQALVSDAAWQGSWQAGPGWQQPGYSARDWHAVRLLGPVGKAGPFPDLVWDERFQVPPGFRVEPAVRPPAADPIFSLINMTFDEKGRLLVSRENGPVLVCTDPDAHGVFQTVRPYCEQVRNCQGMCWVEDALYLVGQGPQGAGLYRVRDSRGQDRADEVVCLHRFAGGMGEHGPHAVLHGPDDWLYLVIGNHAWAQIGPDVGPPNPRALAANSPWLRWPTGRMGPDQGRPDTTEDVLLPRMNDARGHAANILAPGGTIWRLDRQGQQMALVAAGFRNAYDAAFSPEGELFTFDSDMEWDEHLPWYRAVRICHCPPGADFVWRTGSANTPDYYLDSLPPLYETGRGSPVGLEFYDHRVFPARYQGAYFLGDWALGVIYAAHLERAGATYKAQVERFCVGAPMNVTDLGVGPDGALYFVLGGRNTQGGVYRIVYDPAEKKPAARGAQTLVDQVLERPQPLAAWSRAWLRRFLQSLKDTGTPFSPQQRLAHAVAAVAHDPAAPTRRRLRALDYLQTVSTPGRLEVFQALAQDREPLVRAHSIWLLGVNEARNARPTLLAALHDADPLVRRRACEALIRAGLEPPLEDLWPLLGDADRFVRHAARLVLERIEPSRWAERLAAEKDDQTAWQAIVALCQRNWAAPYAELVFRRLSSPPAPSAPEKALLDYLRTLQLALIHIPSRPAPVREIAQQCVRLFPQASWRVNRELAILLTAFQREGLLATPITEKLYQALEASAGDRAQQIHYFYCLRLLKEGWTPAMKRGLALWYDGTQSWRGGFSFTPFLENIFRETLSVYTLAERRQLLAEARQHPLPALVLCTRLQLEKQPELASDLVHLLTELKQGRPVFRQDELQQAALGALVHNATIQPNSEYWGALLAGLESSNPLVLAQALRLLRQASELRPQKDDPGPYRAVLTAAARLRSVKDRAEAVALLRQWRGPLFGDGPSKADVELRLWARWFRQTFPKEPLPAFRETETSSRSKYQMGQLLPLLEQAAAQKKGNVARGRQVFIKAQCSKCHKHGADGEGGIGPDLTNLAQRFKRADILESILEPSKVISDQYRAMTITTKAGQELHGLVSVQGDTVTVTLSDASRVVLRKEEIESQVASLVSVMPEQLLDALSIEEIIDLFAYLEAPAESSSAPSAHPK
jgi:putative heme-binding domain-containing protein